MNENGPKLDMGTPGDQFIEHLLKREAVQIFPGSLIKELQEDKSCVSLGSGGYGTCNVVNRDGDRVVLKTFKSDTNFDDVYCELNGLIKNKGPGVQKLIGYCPSEKTLITRYGGDALAQYGSDVEHKTVKKSVAILEDVMTTISQMLKRRWCHNDIKAENICVKKIKTDEPQVTLIDFGLARKIRTEVYEDQGEKKDYLQPHLPRELLRGKSCSKASEVYSLGQLAIQVRPGETSYSKNFDKWIIKS
ncbi:serine/threonine-protein kinase dkf-1-like [Homarus americanus]|uniref:serine/threonine-protein kinase dkf-1-like n=1 Tax=Homarus americanus TaxID=6706 RepID=UPI001C484DD8|nr:serine/threonine-protein kinase dkf-1-like [Homarus americanus]